MNRKPDFTGTASPIRVPKTAELVAAQLRDRIIRGQLKEGDTLQPEAQLIEEFAVSRPTMREAFRILEAEKLISVSRGSRGGAQVHLPDIDVAARYAGLYLQSQKTTIADIFQARSIIEPAAAAMLAKNCSAKSLKILKQCIEDQRSRLEDPDSWVHSGVMFHQLLIELAGNQTLTFVTGILGHILEAHLRFVIGEDARDFSAKQAARDIRSQEKLLGFIEQGKSEEAQKHWQLHLDNVSKILLKSTGPKTVVDILGS